MFLSCSQDSGSTLCLVITYFLDMLYDERSGLCPKPRKSNTSMLFSELCNISVQAAGDEEEPEGRASSEEDSSDDDKSWVEEVREQRRLLRQEDRDRRRQERKEADRNTVLLEREQKGGEKTSNMAESKKSQPQFYQIKAGEEFRSFNDMARKQKLQKYVFGNLLNGALGQVLVYSVGHFLKLRLLFRLL